MSVVTMGVPDEIRADWPHGDLIAAHVDKLMAAHAMASMFASAISGRDIFTGLEDVAEDLERLARGHNQAKQRGFYADLVDGTIWEPASVTQVEARRMVDTVRSLLDHSAPMADPEFITWLVSQDPVALEAKEIAWSALIGGLQRGGPEGMFARSRRGQVRRARCRA